MMRALLILSLFLSWSAPSSAQAPHKVRKEAPPAHGKDNKRKKAPHKVRREAPPAPGQSMPVREPVVFSRFVPPAGPPGIEVVLLGQNFDPTTEVRFNGHNLRVLTRSATELRVRIPQGAVSDRFVILKAGFSDTSPEEMFHVIRPPLLEKFMPQQGPRDTPITVIGNNFLPSDQFVIGDRDLAVQHIRPHRAKLLIPAGATTNLIGIRRDGKVQTWSKTPFQVTGLAPVISDFSPRSGGRGTLVRITGQNFEPHDMVTLNDQRLATRRRGRDFIEVVVSHQGSGRLMLNGPGGRHAEAPHHFALILPLSVDRFYPAFGPPGTQITIKGTGFLTDDQAFIGGAMLSVRSITENTIQADVPTGVQSGSIGVQRGRKRVQARGIFEVIRAPAISNIEPTSGPPGIQVKIMGRDFVPGVTVHLAGQQLHLVKQHLPDFLIAVIPPTARSGRLVVVTKGGSAQSSINFQVTHFATLTSFFPLHGLPRSRVTLRGSFHPGIQLFLARMPVPLISQMDDTVVAEIPEGARSGTFMVQSFGRQISLPQVFKVDEPVPEISFTFSPPAVVRGNEVTLTVTPPDKKPLTVFFNGQPLPKKTLHNGRTLVVIVPSNASSGYFEIEYQGRRYRSQQQLRVR